MAKDKRSTGSFDPTSPKHPNKGPIFNDPEVFRATLPPKNFTVKRVVGIDLGTNCGFAYCDVNHLQPKHTIVSGLWDLSIGKYDSGPLRHIRLKQFLELSQPDLLIYEEVKYDPPADLIKAKGMGPGAIVARVATAAEFLGGLKVTVSTWAEERGVPAEGVPIAQIKKFATGKGNAGKADMIKAANELFGVALDPAEYESNGDDNIADALFVCAMGVQEYWKGLK